MRHVIVAPYLLPSLANASNASRLDFIAGIMKAKPRDLPKGARWRDKETAVNFQAFRPTFASWLQKTGSTAKDYQGAMRHASPEVTLGVNMKEIPASVAAAVDALDSMLNPVIGTGTVQ